MVGYVNSNYAVLQGGTGKGVLLCVGNDTFGSGAAVTVTSAGAIRFNAYGAGVLTTDASGNVTATGTPSIATSLTVPTIYGSAASGGNLQLHSTSHATKGKIYLGSTATVDDANSRFGIGTTSPGAALDVAGQVFAGSALTGCSLSIGDGTNASNYIALRRGSTAAMVGYVNSNYAVLQGGTGKGVLLCVGNDTFGSGAAVTVTSAGAVGIGTSSPGAALDVAGQVFAGSALTGCSLSIGNGTNVNHYIALRRGTTAAMVGYVNSDYAVLQGGAGKGVLLCVGNDTFGSGAAVTVTSAGAIRFNAYGAGALTTDASGNITAVSDMRHKQFRRLFAKGMAELQAIDPIVYMWRPESGMETEHEYVGFSAQNVQESLPEAVGQDSRGYLTLQDRAILAALLNAVKGQQAQIDALMAQ